MMMPACMVCESGWRGLLASTYHPADHRPERLYRYMFLHACSHQQACTETVGVAKKTQASSQQATHGFRWKTKSPSEGIGTWIAYQEGTRSRCGWAARSSCRRMGSSC